MTIMKEYSRINIFSNYISLIMLGSLVVLFLASLSVASPVLEKRAITCLRVGQTATASWTNAAGKKCTFTGVVGSNFGANPSGSGE